MVLKFVVIYITNLKCLQIIVNHFINTINRSSFSQIRGLLELITPSFFLIHIRTHFCFTYRYGSPTDRNAC